MTQGHTGYNPQNSMRDLIRDNAMLLPAISRFNIAFGFGDEAVEEVCRRNDVDAPTFLCVCNLLSGYRYNAAAISLPTLMSYLRRAHSYFLDLSLPRIRHHLIEAINFSGTDEVALLLIRFFDDYVKEVCHHMEHENNVIFTYVDQLLQGQPNPQFSIARYSGNHSSMAEKLQELKDIFIFHYKQRDNARLSAALFDIMTCERDLMSHFEVENELLIPAVKTLENRVMASHIEAEENEAEDSDEANSPVHLLSEREKDIIRCVAQGKSNKEIAETLFISVHTVATHRRNISAKLGIHSPAGLVIFAIINHLVDINDVSPIS